jgi:hypothetical protein
LVTFFGHAKKVTRLPGGTRQSLPTTSKHLLLKLNQYVVLLPKATSRSVKSLTHQPSKGTSHTSHLPTQQQFQH